MISRSGSGRYAALIALACLGVSAPGRVAAQPHSTRTSAERPPGGAQFKIPLASLFVPGIGQFVYGRPAAGVAYLGTGLAGLGLYATGDPNAINLDAGLPRSGDAQRAFFGIQLTGTAGALSAYDAFQSTLPALRRNGEYEFLETQESMGALFTAPFDFRFLLRWTTWVEFAYMGAITALVAIEGTEPGKIYQPFTAGDAAFTTGVSLNAAVGEEALFRGWLYPLLYENVNPRWLANPIQAAIFGALHPQAGPFAVVIGGWALYQGWLTTRNDWSIRESIFHHFWYDVFVIAATLLTDEPPGTVTLSFPTLRF